MNCATGTVGTSVVVVVGGKVVVTIGVVVVVTRGGEVVVVVGALGRDSKLVPAPLQAVRASERTMICVISEV
ncbi:MAG: hypothetical protein MKZ77_06795 [Acidimicrobiales bacterium]|nr:hypothetical protein [Acidimicrobiales bacterium]MEC8922970.1 hypothetical protein [Actinomycetota bacterium]